VATWPAFVPLKISPPDRFVALRRHLNCSDTLHMVKPPVTVELWIAMVLMVGSLVFASVAQSAGLPDLAGVVDRSFESITINGANYQNVTIYRQTATDVILKHDQGLTGLKVANLDNPTLRRLGYRVEEADPPTATGHQTALKFLSGLINSGGFRQWSTFTLIGLVVLTIGMYIYTSYLFWLICVKTETRPGILVWLPFLQIFPLLRAARMSSLWVAALILIGAGTGYAAAQWPAYAVWADIFSAIATLVLWSVWALRICQVRGKGIVTVILLLVPGMNYLALLYLAGSK
jgi:hypothetical protein